MHQDVFQPFAPRQVRLLSSLFSRRADLNRAYLGRLTDDNLLRAHRMEAGLWYHHEEPLEGIHGGWDAPTSQLRGQFLGHWMSAAARIVANDGDPVFKARLDRQVEELARCQTDNGGEWIGPIPEKYLHWTTTGKYVWAPHYVIHKGLMGLLDAYTWGGNEQALDILIKFAKWFSRWTEPFDRETMDRILDVETGGMLESWAQLYGITGDEEHLALITKYDRPRFFDRLLSEGDVLTNQHANTTVPEVEGAARAWEVTGDPRWRQIVEAYWRQAVTERGCYCTGGQTNGEVWTPPGEMAARLSDKNQEHCVVYNMMRLAEFLLRWTGDPVYADFIERNLNNGVLAQQNPRTGMVAYFMPLGAGHRKKWGTETGEFWCCHGTLVQAHTLYNQSIYYRSGDGVAVCGNIPSELVAEIGGAEVKITQTEDRMTGANRRPTSAAFNLKVETDRPQEFTLKVRVPWWIAGEAVATIDGAVVARSSAATSFMEIRRRWAGETVRVELPRKLYTEPLPGDPSTVAFMEGPVVLAGLCDSERKLVGDPSNPLDILTPDNERQWTMWMTGYRTRQTDPGVRFVPLNEVEDEAYSVYFRV